MSDRLISLLQAALPLIRGNNNPLYTFLEELAAAGGTIPALSNANPLPLGPAAPGVSPDASRADHVHPHGDQGGGSEHTLGQRSPGLAGFVSPVDLDQLDLNTTTINAILIALSTLLSNTNPLPLGLSSPGVSGQASRADHVHPHGNQGGGLEHALATALAAGFMAPSDVTLLGLLAPLVTPVTQFVATTPVKPSTVTTRAPGTVFEGSQLDVPRRAQVRRLYGRLTGFTTLGAGLRVAVYQVPGGGPVGVANKLAEAVVTPGVVGAQDITLDTGATFTLEQGIAFLLFGRSTATAGVTLRTWSIGTIERITTTVPAGLNPLTFSTAFPSTAPGPATLTAPTNFTALAASSAFCGQFGP